MECFTINVLITPPARRVVESENRLAQFFWLLFGVESWAALIGDTVRMQCKNI